MQFFNVTASSYKGCVRENNEDMLLVGERYFRDDTFDTKIKTDGLNRFLFALADGMGGHNCGEVASLDVLQNLQFFFGDLPSGLNPSAFNETINEWLSSINSILDGRGKSNPWQKNMGTTLVAFAYYEQKFYWMNCGDSRLYRFHDGHLQQMTTDHSLNTLTGETKHSHIITNCIGGGCTTSFIDIVECTDKVEVGDTFLLCSDGLTDMVSDANIEKLLISGADSAQLSCAAEGAGGHDNISVILIGIE